MLLRSEKLFISRRTRRTKNFVRLHVLFNTAVYRYDMEVDLHSKTLVCFQTDIFWSLFMPADSLVEFLAIPSLLEQLHLKDKQLQPKQAITKRHCARQNQDESLRRYVAGKPLEKIRSEGWKYSKGMTEYLLLCLPD